MCLYIIITIMLWMLSIYLLLSIIPSASMLTVQLSHIMSMIPCDIMNMVLICWPPVWIIFS